MAPWVASGGVLRDIATSFWMRGMIACETPTDALRIRLA
jgi:hypothetical protein